MNALLAAVDVFSVLPTGIGKSLFTRHLFWKKRRFFSRNQLFLLFRL